MYYYWFTRYNNKRFFISHGTMEAFEKFFADLKPDRFSSDAQLSELANVVKLLGHCYFIDLKPQFIEFVTRKIDSHAGDVLWNNVDLTCISPSDALQKMRDIHREFSQPLDLSLPPLPLQAHQDQSERPSDGAARARFVSTYFYGATSRIKMIIPTRTTICRTPEELFGCSMEYLACHIESMFPGNLTPDLCMKWSNYGTWEIDHIKPVTTFKNLHTPLEQSQCFFFHNLRPVWRYANLRRKRQFGDIQPPEKFFEKVSKAPLISDDQYTQLISRSTKTAIDEAKIVRYEIFKFYFLVDWIHDSGFLSDHIGPLHLDSCFIKTYSSVSTKIMYENWRTVIGTHSRSMDDYISKFDVEDPSTVGRFAEFLSKPQIAKVFKQNIIVLKVLKILGWDSIQSNVTMRRDAVKQNIQTNLAIIRTLVQGVLILPDNIKECNKILATFCRESFDVPRCCPGRDQYVHLKPNLFDFLPRVPPTASCTPHRPNQDLWTKTKKLSLIPCVVPQ